MAVLAENRFTLKTLHDEIDLFDRKLAHLAAHEKFATESDREAAAHKLAVKRNTLVETARRMVSNGIEFKLSELPRSLRSKDEVAAEASAKESLSDTDSTEELTPAVAGASQPTSASLQHASPFAGTSLDWSKSIAQYRESRKKA